MRPKGFDPWSTDEEIRKAMERRWTIYVCNCGQSPWEAIDAGSTCTTCDTRIEPITVVPESPTTDES